MSPQCWDVTSWAVVCAPMSSDEHRATRNLLETEANEAASVGTTTLQSGDVHRCAHTRRRGERAGSPAIYAALSLKDLIGQSESVPLEGFEPPTRSLGRSGSSTELQRQGAPSLDGPRAPASRRIWTRRPAFSSRSDRDARTKGRCDGCSRPLPALRRAPVGSRAFPHQGPTSESPGSPRSRLHPARILGIVAGSAAIHGRRASCSRSPRTPPPR